MKNSFIPLAKRLSPSGDVTLALKRDLKVENVNALPKITKVIVNVGLNQKKYSAKDIQQYISDALATITSQRPSVRRSRLSISNFNIRQKLIVGMAVTLRGKRMYNFLDRVIHYALPRIRDFRGLTPKLDGQGNYAIGIIDHTIFPEVPPPDVNKIFGMQIQITTNARTDARGLALLKLIGVPFRRPSKTASGVEKK